MDSLRAFEETGDVGFARDEEPAMDTPPEIGVDERRMHVRAYNYWVSILHGRPYPAIEDVDPESLGDFGPHSVLLDFTADSENPAVPFIGRALREECALAGNIRTIADVPSRSLLSRLTDHYLQIIANCAPIGFEAEFVNQRGHNTMYRGILMPLSSDGEKIDFIYGVINWKEVADPDTAAGIAREVDRAVAAAPAVEASPIWADGPNADPIDTFAPETLLGSASADEFASEEDPDQPLLSLVLDEDAALADRLCAARDIAEAVKRADARSRSALYAALSEAYDFALAADEAPDDYREILADAGVKEQARAPMTPVVKLIFGVDYDKARITEFAAALSFARRSGLGRGELRGFLESHAGGLKGVVQAERQQRRPAAEADPSEKARNLLRQAQAIGYVDVAADEEFVLLVARRGDDGRLEVIAPVRGDKSLLDRAIRKSVAA